MGTLGKQGNKTPAVFRSGMRGGEKPRAAGLEPSEAELEKENKNIGTREGATAKEDGAGGLSKDEGSEAYGYSELVSQHIKGPDENGHHHLNLTTLAAALRDKSEGTPGES
jgi:hypothetical protein